MKICKSVGPYLLAEDNLGDAVLMECALHKAGFRDRIHVVEDGKEAIRYLAGEGRYRDRDAHPYPALMLLDLQLPKIDGTEVLRWMQECEDLPYFPVIVMTGSLNTRRNESVLKLGAATCLNKPLGFQELADTLKEHLEAFFPDAPAEEHPGLASVAG